MSKKAIAYPQLEINWKQAAINMRKQPDFHKLHYEKLKEIEMAKIIKKAKKVVKSAPAPVVKKVGRPANPDNATAKEGKPVVIHLPNKLHARAKLGCIALSTNLSTVLRGLLSQWTKDNAKKIASVISMADDEDEDEVEDTEVEDTDNEEEDEDAEESEDEEDEDASDDDDDE